jgi:hypothetical protein
MYIYIIINKFRIKEVKKDGIIKFYPQYSNNFGFTYNNILDHKKFKPTYYTKVDYIFPPNSYCESLIDATTVVNNFKLFLESKISEIYTKYHYIK